jgi:hypothetical protein
VVELEGAQRVSPNALADAFAKVPSHRCIGIDQAIAAMMQKAPHMN